MAFSTHIGLAAGAVQTVSPRTASVLLTGNNDITPIGMGFLTAISIGKAATENDIVITKNGSNVGGLGDVNGNQVAMTIKAGATGTVFFGDVPFQALRITLNATESGVVAAVWRDDNGAKYV